MDPIFQDCLNKWISLILKIQIPKSKVINGEVLFELINLTDDIRIDSADLKCEVERTKFVTFLNGCYQFPASELFDLESVAHGEASDDEAYGLCLLVLITCLQSRTKQFFIDAALALDHETQIMVFNLLREPMTMLSADQQLTREILLSGFRESLPTPQSPVSNSAMWNQPNNHLQSSPLIDDPLYTEATPIKSFSHAEVEIRQSWCGAHDTTSLSANPDPCSDALHHSWTAGSCVPESEAHPNNTSVTYEKQTSMPDSTFRVPLPPAESRKIASHPSNSDYPMEFGQMAGPMVNGERNRRPTDLTIRTGTQMSQSYRSQTSLPHSVGNSLLDLSECGGFGSRQMLQPHSLASPLAPLKHWLDSPVWTQKSRLREAERERRRLLGDLEKERAYRDEVENVVAELRASLEEARVRTAEAESKAMRMQRELAAFHDQTDELSVCRSELTLREEEIGSLKQRLNTLQDVAGRIRKLESENSNLHHECADHRQKVEQLTAKLSEIKDRRMVCSEVETLRSKLQDVETQLAQQLRDREYTERESRRQQEMYNQLKMQQSLAEKRREKLKQQHHNSTNRNHLNVVSYPGLNHELDSLVSSHQSSINDFEFEGQTLRNTQSQDLGQTDTKLPSTLVVKSTDSSREPLSVRSGENLGSVLENELQSAHAQVARLQCELSTALQDASTRNTDVSHLTEELDRLTAGVSKFTVQQELDREEARGFQTQFINLQTDLSTLEGRLLWPFDGSDDSEDWLEHLQTLSDGLSDPLVRLCDALYTGFGSRCHDQEIKWTEAMKVLRQSCEELQQKLSEKEEELVRLHEHSQQDEQAWDSERVALKEEIESSLSRVRVLESEFSELRDHKSDLECRLAKLKDQTDAELAASREMLTRATVRLEELENQRLKESEKAVHLDVETQTNESVAQLPVVEMDASLEHLDMLEPGINLDADDDLLSAQCDLSHTTYEALAADRRGLSTELVRLHDELAESLVCTQQLEHQNTDLIDRLTSTETALGQRTALLNRAQENWALLERKDRENEEKMRRLRNEHAAQLEALRSEMLPQFSRCQSEAAAAASQVEAARAKFENERTELRRRLHDTELRLETSTAERNQLVLQNLALKDNLQSTEVQTPHRWPSNEQLKPAHFHDSREKTTAPVEPACMCTDVRSDIGGSVENWVAASCVEVHHQMPIKSTEPQSNHLSPSSGSSSGYPSLNDSNLNGPVDINHSSDSELRHLHRSGSVRKPQTSARLSSELARLSSRTEWLESIAKELAEKSQNTQLAKSARQQKSHPMDPYSPTTIQVIHPSQRVQNIPTELSGAIQRQTPAPINRVLAPTPHSVPVHYEPVGHDLDTDADSAAYTDLSQVSISSRQAPHSTIHLRPNGLADVSSLQMPPRSDPIRSPRFHLMDQPTSSRIESAPLIRNSPHSEVGSDPLDPNRIFELHRRNRLQPMHMRTSYPVETQNIEPAHIAGAIVEHLSASTSPRHNPEQSSKTKYSHKNRSSSTDYQPHPSAAAVQNGHVLREVDSDNQRTTANSKHQRSVAGASDLLSRLGADIVEDGNVSSPLAAGYRDIPKQLSGMTDALLAATEDPMKMATALTAELSRASLSAPNSSRSNAPGQSRQQRVQSARLVTQQPSTVYASGPPSSTGCAFRISPPKPHRFTDENASPPSASTRQQYHGPPATLRSHANGIKSDPFVRPAPPSHPSMTNGRSTVATVHRSLDHDLKEDSDDENSVASSVRSYQSSIAFEIPVDSSDRKPRRVPGPRAPSSQTIVRRGTRPVRTDQPSTVIRNGQSQRPVNSRPVRLETGFSSQDSFRMEETPLQRNPRCLNSAVHKT